MLFDVKQFEQFFNEKPLKKGLRFFEKGEFEFKARQTGFEYLFLVDGASLRLKKKGDKLLEYKCHCKSSDYCEHLSTALFYFQQEALGISVKKKKVRKKLERRQNSGADNSLAKLENASLASFVVKNKNELHAADILSFLSDKSTLTFFDVYCLQLELILEPYLALKKMEQEHIEKLLREMKSLIKKAKKFKKISNDLFYLDLALVNSFCKLFSLRFTGDEKSLFELYNHALENLELAFVRGLSAKERAAWFKTTLTSIETNKNLLSGTFLFLVPRFVCKSKSAVDLELLRSTLEKRNYKVTYAQQLNKLLIARFEVGWRAWELFGIPLQLQNNYGEVEKIVAKAELLFCLNKNEKAFELLEAHYDEVKTVYKNFHHDYQEYVLNKARRKSNNEIEVKHLGENFVGGLFILPENLERYLALIPINEQKQKIDELVSKIRARQLENSFDKLVMLLMRNNRLDELIEVIKREGNKFSLLHRVMMLKLPEVKGSQVELYIKQLLEAVALRRGSHYQEQLIDLSKIFIDRLPSEMKLTTIHRMLDQLGGQSWLHKYVDRVYATDLNLPA